MPQSEAVRAAIERAKANREAQSWAVSRTLFDEEFTFRFVPTMPGRAVEMIAHMRSQQEDVDDEEKVRSIHDLLDLILLPESSELVAELYRDGILTLSDLASLQREGVARIGGRSFDSASSSDSGSTTPGPSSTDGAGAAA